MFVGPKEVFRQPPGDTSRFTSDVESPGEGGNDGETVPVGDE